MSRRLRLPGFAPLLLAATILVIGLLVVMPLGVVFAEAFAKGAGPYFAALKDPDALAAIRLTLTAAAIAVPLNAVFEIGRASCRERVFLSV